MARKKKSMDGNTAAAHVSYAFTEVAGIYPITPSSPMADNVDQWAAAGRKNIFGDPVRVIEMQSEAGAAGTVHGSLNAGALTTTYTASQGLLLMIPNMYKIAGELLPAVFHVSARTVAAQSLNIFGDHSDVMACRQTGFAMLCETNPQEVMDLGAVAHLAAIEGRVPFLNFFDGFRTSHEIQKIEIWDYDDLKDMVDMDAVAAFRARALNPEHPTMRGSHENGDIFFQHREASNKYYEAVPEIVEKYMGKVNAKLGTDYQLFNYYGAADADRVIIAMGSICDVAEEVIDYLNAHGEKVGLLKVRLYRPFRADKMLAAIPATAKKIAVLDRTKEPGSQGEPLYLDVVTAFANAGRQATIVGGRYGLGSKDTPPKSVFAVYEELAKDAPKHQFTIGIVDDVTNLSLPEHDCPNTAAEGTIECKFWGLGGDGTVGANKNSIKIIGDHTDKYVQAYFQYDSKKTGGVTISHLRFGDKPIRSPYYINKADFVACHVPAYIIKAFPMVRDVKDGGTFLINCQWSDEELNEHMPAVAKRYIAEHNIQVYTIDAIDLAAKIGMGKRTNTILQSAFFKLAKVMPEAEAIGYMKDAATHSYLKKGQDVVDMNHKAIDMGATAFKKFTVPADWANAVDEKKEENLEGRAATVKMVQEIMEPVGRMDGDSLPVSAFAENHADGTFEQGAAAYEKRGVAVNVPTWDSAKCIQCNQCSYVCPHATIRPYALTEEEAKNAPAAAKIVDVKAGKGKGVYKFSIAVSPLDCMGCGVCVGICPVKALEMVPQESQADQQPVFDYMVAKVADKADMADTTSVKGSQFNQPLLEFSGSCAGCAETSYARLITQVCGDRMYISNATGCSSIWGGPAATSPYTVNKVGHGPAWANSLFEDNAEHGLGFYYGQKALRDRLTEQTKALLAIDYADESIKTTGQAWLDTMADGEANAEATKKYVAALEAVMAANGDCGCDACKLAREILAHKEFLAKKSIWIFGGDGWAYDIGFGGLDHVLASGEDVNVFVFDTEVYSNTGGQASKATNVGAVAQFAAAGKTMPKKSLAEIAMSYGYVYVAQVAMGANPAQTLKAINEAESYHGPSLIIGYAPCEMHSIKGGMTNCQSEMKKAVDCGYWNLFRFNPALKAEGKSPFTLDSKAPAGGYQEFLMNEARYSALTRAFPDRAEKLFKENEELAKARYEHLVKLQELYA
ncbi:pyruvate:ferredoxin (flavodoxin) oxidoreductase [Intestinimonas butyriciproducens]|uniref:pyruvate:ferredoxin (flavodoxin) oxidoreductase n=1 Tax=Intestinimonas butyriciproducens TaxID=1297617 RepID=UPI00195E388F|nr:pyruvate:ferredoxin (flavodoxin) oxidoreductase [Intestinimonas butyriciproducens]MBM6975472.1 pyruvate:ferredoxin (flavodoxin) oxidoreductase [Intestinimonas butyriciproducens]